MSIEETTIKQNLAVGLLVALAFYMGFTTRAKASGSRRVDVTKVNSVNGGYISGHIEGFSCISQADVEGQGNIISTTHDTYCYVLTSAD